MIERWFHAGVLVVFLCGAAMGFVALIQPLLGSGPAGPLGRVSVGLIALAAALFLVDFALHRLF